MKLWVKFDVLLLGIFLQDFHSSTVYFGLLSLNGSFLLLVVILLL